MHGHDCLTDEKLNLVVDNKTVVLVVYNKSIFLFEKKKLSGVGN